LITFSAVNTVSAFTSCYPVNDQEYCFYMHDSVMSWNEAREFCATRHSTLPTVTDENVDIVFKQFILDSNNAKVDDRHTKQLNISVWLGAHADRVDDSDEWHWINGQPSGKYSYAYVEGVQSIVMSMSRGMSVCPTTCLENHTAKNLLGMGRP